ncbi:hypothetical protein [Streptomyces erythrochromogenes]
MHDYAVLLTPDEARAMLRELETVSTAERETLALVVTKLTKTLARAAEAR